MRQDSRTTRETTRATTHETRRATERATARGGTTGVTRSARVLLAALGIATALAPRGTCAQSAAAAATPITTPITTPTTAAVSAPVTAPATLVALPANAAPVPFAVGEELTYKATFGRIPAGTARMAVEGIELVRGRPAYHVVFTLEGGVPLFRVRDRYESWIDVETLASLRHRQQIHEGRYKRTTTYEIYPERAQYQKNDDSLTASVRDPLDEGSLLYAARAAAVRVGETRREDRYFKPDRNPVLLSGVRHDTVTVPAGSFPAVVVAPSVKAKGIFAEGGAALVWFSDDARRYPVRVESRFAGIGITLVLQSVTPGETALAAAARADGAGR
jgi:hypothetical protein